MRCLQCLEEEQRQQKSKGGLTRLLSVMAQLVRGENQEEDNAESSKDSKPKVAIVIATGT